MRSPWRERPSVVELSKEVVAHVRGDFEAHFGAHLAGVPEVHAAPYAAVNDSLNRRPERRVRNAPHEAPTMGFGRGS